MDRVDKPKVVIAKYSGGFGISNLLGLIFILVGIALILMLTKFTLPFDLASYRTYMEYGAGAASILGGISMLFDKKK